MNQVSPRSPLAIEIAALNAAFLSAGLKGVTASQPGEKNSLYDIAVRYPLDADSMLVHRVVLETVKDRNVSLHPIVV